MRTVHMPFNGVGESRARSRPTAAGLRIVFAGDEAVEGPGELLRVVGPTTDAVQLRQAAFNDGAIVAWTAAVAHQVL